MITFERILRPWRATDFSPLYQFPRNILQCHTTRHNNSNERRIDYMYGRS